jgi:hypothetical protein
MQEDAPTPESLEESKTLIAAFKDTTSKILNSKTKDDTLMVLKKLTDSFKKTLDQLDKYLLSKNVDVGKHAESLKNKGKQLKDKVIGFIAPSLDDVKEKGLLNVLRNTRDNVLGKLQAASQEDDQTQGAPPLPGVPPLNQEPRKFNPMGLVRNTGSKVKSKLQEVVSKGREVKDMVNSGEVSKTQILKNLGNVVKVKTKQKYDQVKEENKVLQELVEAEGTNKLKVLQKYGTVVKNKGYTDKKKLEQVQEPSPLDPITQEDTAAGATLQGIRDKLLEFAKNTKDTLSAGYEDIKLRGEMLSEDLKVRAQIYQEDFKKNNQDLVSTLEGIQEKVKDFSEGAKETISSHYKDAKLKTQMFHEDSKLKAQIFYNDFKLNNSKLITTLGSIRDKIGGFAQSAKELVENSAVGGKLVNAKSRAAGFLEAGKQRLKNTFAKATERSERRKAEIEEEKAAARGGAGGKKDGKGKGMFGSLMGMIGGALTAGVGFLFSSLVGIFTKTIIPWIGKGIAAAFAKLIPGLIPAISGGISTALGAAAMGAGKLLVAGAVGVGNVALGAVTAIGVPIVLGVVAVGALVFGGYKLYKYLTRDDVSKAPHGKLTRLRLLMYGFNDINKDHYHRLFELEMLMKDFVGFKKGVVVIKTLTPKAKEDILKLFEVKRDDKTRFDLFNNWYKKRFIPSFVGFMQAMYNVRPELYLDDLEKLSPNNTFMMMSSFTLPTDIFSVKQVPTFEQPDCLVTEKDVEDMLASIRGITKEMSSKDDVDPKETSKKNKENATSQASQADARRLDDEKAREIPKVQGGQSDVRRLDNETAKKAEMGDADQTPNETAGAPAPPPTVNTGSVKMASGALLPGSPTLEGINSRTDKKNVLALEPNTLNLLSGMAKEYNVTTGKSIPINSANRSPEDQARLYAQNPAKAAKPGRSMHEFGVGIDTDSAVGDELDKLGLLKKYGFTRPIGGEKWHLEPAGVALNPGLVRADPLSRAKRVLSSPGRGGGGYGSIEGSPLGRRNMELQKKLFESSEGVPVDLAKEATKEPGSPSNLAPSVSAQPSAAAPAEDKSIQQVAAIDTASKEPETKPKETSISSAGSGATQPSIMQKSLPGPLDPTATPVKPSSPNIDMGKVTDPNMSVSEAIKKASALVGVSEDTMIAFAKMESSMNAGAKNGKSSATGLMQFTTGTWKEALTKYGPRYNIPPDAQPTSPYYSAVLGAAYGKNNLKSIAPLAAKAGLRDDTAMYLTHHFGPSGGARIVNAFMATPAAPIEQAVSARAMKDNQEVLSGKTVSGYIGHLNGKIDKVSATTYAGETPRTTARNNAGPASVTPTTATTAKTTQAASPVVPVSTQAQSQPGAYKASFEPPVQKPTIFAQNNKTNFEQPAQPSPALNLNKTESLLSGMGDTLLSIKTVLEAIRDKASTQAPGPSENPTTPPQDSPSENYMNRQAGGASPALRTRSKQAVSMSRQPQNT